MCLLLGDRPYILAGLNKMTAGLAVWEWDKVLIGGLGEDNFNGCGGAPILEMEPEIEFDETGGCRIIGSILAAVFGCT